MKPFFFFKQTQADSIHPSDPLDLTFIPPLLQHTEDLRRDQRLSKPCKDPHPASQTHHLIVEFTGHQTEKMKVDILSNARAANKGIYSEGKKKKKEKIDIWGVNQSHVIYPWLKMSS